MKLCESYFSLLLTSKHIKVGSGTHLLINVSRHTYEQQAKAMQFG